MTRVSAGIGDQLAKAIDHYADRFRFQPVPAWDPAVSLSDRPPSGVRKRLTHDQGGYGFWVGGAWNWRVKNMTAPTFMDV